MKKILFAAIGVMLLSVSCRKDFPSTPQNPLNSEYQVAECHNDYYDAALEGHIAYPFIKKYDPTGRTVTEIDCAFDDLRPPYTFYSTIYHEFKISQKGRLVYVINKALPVSGIPDTAATITLNAQGRPLSCAVDSNLAFDGIFGTRPNFVQEYTYSNNKVVSVHDIHDPNNPIDHDRTFNVTYDQYGNVSSFNSVAWHYDYTKTAKQQFYCLGLTGSEEPFYLLLYLGYFPEVSSPTNILTSWTDGEGTFEVSNHKLDKQGRLISYDERVRGSVSIRWK